MTFPEPRSVELADRGHGPITLSVHEAGSGSDRPAYQDMPQLPAMQATNSAVVGIGRAALSFDFRAREFAVMTGSALGGSFDLAGPGFGSDLRYWRVGASYEHGTKLFRAHNFIYSAYAATGHNLPFWNEYTAGGPNLRGYLYQQFRGDSQVSGKVEYHFPLFSIGSMDFRALGFYDYLPTQESGFSPKRDIHNDVGGGLRFFLRSVAIPLVGFDAGYGLEAQSWRFIVVVGA